ncbi:unnamed protein product [Calypogeia fissa]
MYSFYVQVEEEVMEVWEEAGAQLFGMPRHEFVKENWNAMKRNECCQQAMEELWTVKLWRPKDGEKGRAARVISFSQVITKTKTEGVIPREEANLPTDLNALKVGESSSKGRMKSLDSPEGTKDRQ